MQVIIGVDPHKATHTAVALSDGEDELARKKVRATRVQVQQLLGWAEPFPKGDRKRQLDLERMRRSRGEVAHQKRPKPFVRSSARRARSVEEAFWLSAG